MPDGRLLGAMSDGIKARLANYDTGKFVKEMFLQVKATEVQAAAFYAFMRSQIGKPYDTWAVLSFFDPSRDWQDPSAYDCSELIGTAFSECGLFPKHLAVAFSRITPRDIFLLASTLIGVEENV